MVFLCYNHVDILMKHGDGRQQLHLRFGKTVKVRITCNRREMKRLEACESDGSVIPNPMAWWVVVEI